MKQFQTSAKISARHRMVVYHSLTTEICNSQLYIKAFLKACQCFQSRDIETVYNFCLRSKMLYDPQGRYIDIYHCSGCLYILNVGGFEIDLINSCGTIFSFSAETQLHYISVSV